MTKLDQDDYDYMMEHTKDLWEELIGKRIFFTGGTGFVGCWMLEALYGAVVKYSLTTDITILSRTPIKLYRKAAHLRGICNVEFGDVLDGYGEGKYKYDYVVHAASETADRHNPNTADEIFRTIVLGTKMLLSSVDIGKLLYISSGAANQQVDPLAQTSCYAESKRMAEWLCCNWARQNNKIAVIARPYSFIGPYLPLNTHHAMGNWIGAAMRGERLTINGEGNEVRSYMYGADMAVWLWTILLKGRNCTAYDVGSDMSAPIKDLVKQISPNIETLNQHRGKTYIPNTYNSRTLGLKEGYSFKQGIDKTIAWYKRKDAGK
jgi:nucleoside-diphosphate-sugar epimerase